MNYAVCIINGHATYIEYEDPADTLGNRSLEGIKSRLGFSDYSNNSDGIKHLTASRFEARQKCDELNARKVTVPVAPPATVKPRTTQRSRKEKK